jgi:hypothetical protein
MPVKFNEKLIAYLALFSGLTLSVVAEYYSIVGLTAIFPTAVIPVIIMGIALGLGKIVATVWLKQNWSIAPFAIKTYLMIAILTLMFITSMGIFGFLSKAHLEQSVPTGEVAAKIALIDEQLRVEKENIDDARKSLAQLDAQVDQRLSRSTDDRGAERAVQIRRQQQAERSRLQKDIVSAQSNIGRLNSERAPIASELRKVEAEVGPIKYIAQFVYGESDQTLLEKAVTWVIIILIIVFDPMALILLLASQISFQNFRDREKEIDWQARTNELLDTFEDAPDPWVADVGEKPTAEELAEGDSPEKESDVVSTATVTKSILEQHPYLNQPFKHFENLKPMVYKPEVTELPKDPTPPGWMYQTTAEPKSTSTYQIFPELKEELDKSDSLFVQNEEQKESNLWSKTAQAISEEDYLNISQERLEQQVNYYASMLRNKQIDPKDIPGPLLPLVKSRV